LRAGTIVQVLGPAPLVTGVANPLPASPTLPEADPAIRLFAAAGFRTQRRGVTPADWERLARADPLVTAVSAARGSDGRCTIGLETRAPQALTFPLASARLLDAAVLGAEPNIGQAGDVPLDVALVAYCRPGANIAAVRERLAQRFGPGTLPDGLPAFFNPANWPLGRSFRLDELTAELAADPDIAMVVRDPASDPRLRLHVPGSAAAQAAATLASGHVEVAPMQRVRVVNDPFRPEAGRFALYLVASP
jgi:hypothetical protein